MARRPTKPGTYGEINVRTVKPGTAYAETWFRRLNGAMKRVRRYGPTQAAAKARLKDACAELAKEAVGGKITPDTRMQVIGELYLAECDIHVANKTMAPGTVRQYRSYMKNWINPAIGELQGREAQELPGSFNRLVLRAQNERSYDAAKSLKAVLSGMCAFGVREGAMTVNPMASTARLRRGEKKKIVALTAAQRIELRQGLVDLGEARQYDSRGRSLGSRALVWRQLPDKQDCMLSTGARIGELLSLTGEDVIVKDGKVRVLIRSHLDRIAGQGLVRVAGRKFGDEDLDLLVPEWSVPTWRRLKIAAGPGPLFPSSRGGWQDPSNMGHRLREAFDACGFEWVTSHVWRKTVSDVLKDAGLPTSMIADQLGNTVAVVERHYRQRYAANDVAAAALGGMMDEPQQDHGEPETG